MDDLIEFKEKTKKVNFTNTYYAILVFVLLFIVILTQLFSISEVSGESMRETIQSGDYIVIMPGFSYERGDIVTADTGEIHIVKRVVGLPGDRLVFCKADDDPLNPSVSLYIDEGDGFKKVKEPYIRHGVMKTDGFIRQDMFLNGEYSLFSGNIDEVTEKYIITLNKGEYFLMGDNRDYSKDSRYYGPFPNEKIMGKVVDVVTDGPSYFFLSLFYSFMDWLGFVKN